MVKDEKWHGIPCQDILWFPTVDADACLGCALCYTTCGRGVFEMRDNKAVPVNAMSCMVGCSAVSPVEAISFPDRDIICKLEREHKIFRIVRWSSHSHGSLRESAIFYAIRCHLYGKRRHSGISSRAEGVDSEKWTGCCGREQTLSFNIERKYFHFAEIRRQT